MALPLAFAAAGLAHPRARLALPLGRDRHPGAARQGARDHRGQVARRARRGGIGAGAAAEAADRPRRRGLPAVAPRSRPARPAIRPDAGRAAAAAPALARRLASRSSEAASAASSASGRGCASPPVGSSILVYRTMPAGEYPSGGPAMSKLRAVSLSRLSRLRCRSRSAAARWRSSAGSPPPAGQATRRTRNAASPAPFDDLAIKTNIQNAWLQVNPLMQRDFTVTVYEGRTLLTGMAPNPELKAQAAQIASQIPGVRAIYNEIEVAPTEGAWAERQGHLDLARRSARTSCSPARSARSTTRSIR